MQNGWKMKKFIQKLLDCEGRTRTRVLFTSFYVIEKEQLILRKKKMRRATEFGNLLGPKGEIHII